MKAGRKWLPVIDGDLCTGCGVCVEACGPACLEIRGRIATLPRPDACGSEAHCVTACPVACIQMAWLPLTGNPSVGKWETASPETRSSGQ